MMQKSLFLSFSYNTNIVHSALPVYRDDGGHGRAISPLKLWSFQVSLEQIAENVFLLLICLSQVIFITNEICNFEF